MQKVLDNSLSYQKKKERLLTRKIKTTRHFYLILCSLVAALLSACSEQSNTRPLNIVFFLVDDLGWRDVGSFGSNFYDTPNIDRLAQEGIKFTHAYGNVKFYPTSRTTVYHEGSAYDILMACRQHKLDYQEAPRLFLGAVQWNISYLDMAEMMSNVEQAQTQPPQ